MTITQMTLISMNLINEQIMKKIFFLSVAVMAAFACSKETSEQILPENELVPMTFEAVNATESKTVLENGTTVKWLPNDVIGIIDTYSDAVNTAYNHQFTVSSIADDGTATFTGEAAKSDFYYATYPYEKSDFVADGGKMRAAFYSTQTASTPGTFDPTFNSSVAVLKNGVFNFHNLGGLIKFTLTKSNVTKVTLTANDGGTVGGVFYVYFNDDGTINEETTTLASARTSIALTPKGSSSFAPGTYYFCAAARTYAGGVKMTFTRSDGDPMSVSTTSDVIVGRSKVTNVGTIDTTADPEPEFKGVEFPVIFPLGYPEGSTNGHCNAANTWVLSWANDDACASATRTTQLWTGTHGKLQSKDQPQAYITWTWADAIKDTEVKHFIETANTAAQKISTFGVKGVWTGDYYEIVLPVEDFAAGSLLELSMPMYTRSGPTFWEVLYKDGSNWVSTATEDLPAFAGSDVKRKATWALPFGGAANANNTTNTKKTVVLEFQNAIAKGEILIRVKCVDGTIVSSGENTVKTVDKPANSNNTANAPFYFWNPGDRDNQAISIELLDI